MASLVPGDTYSIKSTINDTYLTRDATNGVIAQQSKSNASKWAISAGRNGDYEIRPSSDNHQLLRINDLNQLVCSTSGRRITWTIEQRDSNAYVIGNAADNKFAIQHPRSGLVTVALHNNSARQRWTLEPNPASVLSGGSSDGNNTGNAGFHNTFFAGVFAVSGFAWNIQANLRSIADLPVATQMMATGPTVGSYSPTQDDFEAFQVARWALDCFVQSAVPITHPGGRGNYDALRAVSLGGGWVGPYVFQRLLDIAILHPATRTVPIIHPIGTPGDIPSALQKGTSSWNVANRNLFSLCYRLHQALVQLQAGAVVTENLSGTTVKGVHNFSWQLPPRYRLLDWDLPEGTRIMARGTGDSLNVDFEAYQVARWALHCFEQCAIPITHPGGGGNYHAMPDSIRFPSEQSWPCAYVLQRLLDIAALHPAGRQVAVSGHNVDDLGAPELTRAAVSTWKPWNQRLFSFCFRLHRALLDPNPRLPRSLPLATPFEWNVQRDLSIITDLPRATTVMAQGEQWQRSDREAFQVVRWAIALFSSHGIPITNPGGTGIWAALPPYRNSAEGWVYVHLLHRLLEVAALHPAGHQVPIDTDDWSRDLPVEMRAAVLNWGAGIRQLVSFCFRLHRALLQNVSQCALCRTTRN